MSIIYLIGGGPCSGKSNLVRACNRLQPGTAIDLEDFPDRMSRLDYLRAAEKLPGVIGLADIHPSQFMEITGRDAHVCCLFCRDVDYAIRQSKRKGDKQSLWSFSSTTKLRLVNPALFSSPYRFTLFNTSYWHSDEIASHLINSLAGCK